MSLRSIAVLTALILLQLGGCNTANKPPDPAANVLERNHDEVMKRVGCSSDDSSL